jgi:two-component system phosphate regulon sensor histidine kinase PhoR
MKRSLFLKIFAGFFLIVFLLSVVILLFSFSAIRSHYLHTLTEDLERLAQALKGRVIPYIEENRFKGLDAFSKELGKTAKARITIVNTEGIVLADSEGDPGSMENHRYRTEIFQALQGTMGKSIRLSPTLKEEMLYVALPLEKDGKTIGAVRVSLHLKDINKLLSELKTKIALVAVLMIVLLLVFALLFSRSISGPIRKVIAASQQVASGDFKARVVLKNKDELRDLAESFNAMTDELKTFFTELSNKQEELNSIIFSIHEGLLVVDKSGKILLSNESAKKITESELMNGRYYWEVVRSSKFDELINRVMEKEESSSEEVEVNEKIYLSSATYLGSQKLAVVTLHDLTETKRLERIKKEFVVNVTHELRTPLTAIKGFVETLEEEGDKKKQNYLRIIKRNTERLIRIVEDLLSLTELEEKEFPLEREEVNIKELAENVFKIFEQEAKEKDLYLKLLADEKLPLVRADSFRLEQMFVNLLDNALKYTEKGGVTVSLKSKEGEVIIGVQDTGMGIAAEHLPRIFERFYTVNKARSRKLGGTGLGLSIVKHIVLLHGGTILVKSDIGLGTTFTVTLPV